MRRTHLMPVAMWSAWAIGIGCATESPKAEAISADAGDERDAATTVPTDADAALDSAPQCTFTRRLGSELCEKCLRAKCCTPILACESDVSCSAILDCISACILKPNAASCIERCEQSNPEGRQKYDAYYLCLASTPDEPALGCLYDCSQ